MMFRHIGTDVELDAAIDSQLFQVVVQFPQGMLVFDVFFFAFSVSTEDGEQVRRVGIHAFILLNKLHGCGRYFYGEQGPRFVPAIGDNGILQVFFVQICQVHKGHSA
mgnify:CR=1 FL=1